MFSRAATLGDRSGGRPASGVGESPPQHELDLGVGTPQLVCRPPRQGVVNGRVEPQQDAFSLGHEQVERRLLVQGTGVDDRLRAPVAAQHNQKV